MPPGTTSTTSPCPACCRCPATGRAPGRAAHRGGDAAGALGLAFGIACALVEARATGAAAWWTRAIVDIVAMLGTIAQWACAAGQLGGPTPSLFHESPFYDVFECADGRYITLGAIEPQFYALLLDRLGLTDVDPAAQFDRLQWPALKERVRAVIRQRSRDDWCARLEGTDVCFAPVLGVAEAARHPHNQARGNFVQRGEPIAYGAVAPRFLPLPGSEPSPAASPAASPGSQ